MKIFILENVEELTSNYHTNGAMAIIAQDIERAKILSRTNGYKSYFDGTCVTEVSEDEWSKALVYECDATEEKVFIFPDAGCC